jgi:hypothetical protein
VLEAADLLPQVLKLLVVAALVVHSAVKRAPQRVVVSGEGDVVGLEPRDHNALEMADFVVHGLQVGFQSVDIADEGGVLGDHGRPFVLGNLRAVRVVIVLVVSIVTVVVMVPFVLAADELHLISVAEDLDNDLPFAHMEGVVQVVA